MILTGVGMGLAFRVGLFNLGGEGQMIFGALASAVAGHALAGAPGVIALIGAVLAGVVAGAAWAILPGWWEAWFRVPLVVTTLLLNYIAALFATYLAVYPLRDKSGGSTVAQTARAALGAAAADRDRRDAAAPRDRGRGRAPARGAVAAAAAPRSATRCA